jgi:dihydroorotate dehydrogenase subfamily 1
MPDLRISLHGRDLPNPFLIGSGPPGTNANVIAKAFDEGWGGVVSKTACLDADRIINVSPRYSRMRAGSDNQITGWENIELISDRPFAAWLDDFRRLKDSYPDRFLVASITEECTRDAWTEIVERTQATGVDALELNFSCPHGLPERRMGAAIGQDPDLMREVSGWVNAAAKVPVWAKLTPNITDISVPARAALSSGGGGCEGIAAINTILAVSAINLDTLRPEPTVEGYSTPGGYSGRAVRPIALRMNAQVAGVIADEHGGAGQDRVLSALGGIESGDDAAQYLLVGANCVQVCTGVMIHGYRLIHALKAQLEAFMQRHSFQKVSDFRGHSLRYFTTHADLVQRQAAARARERASVRDDTSWSGDTFVEQSASLTGER